MITQDELKQLFHYDPDTGHLIRKVGYYTGRRAGNPHKDGGRKVTIKGKAYKEHRIIWMLVTGQEPKEIDHKNLVRSDNRWNNLRTCTRSQNIANRRVQPNNLAGVRGVNLTEHGRYRVRIMLGGKRLVDKVFGDLASAREFRAEHSQRIFGEFARVE